MYWVRPVNVSLDNIFITCLSREHNARVVTLTVFYNSHPDHIMLNFSSYLVFYILLILPSSFIFFTLLVCYCCSLIAGDSV